MIRDSRKDAKYFEDYIAYQRTRISKKKEKLASCGEDEQKAERVRLSFLKYLLDMIYALFSSGENEDAIAPVLADALDTASEMETVDYESLMNLLSIAIFVGKEEETHHLIQMHEDEIRKDKLLNCFATYCEDGSVLWDREFQVKEVFDCLDGLGASSDKTRVISNYLLDWYDAHSYTAWHDSHKGKNDTYVGYWSFESAALAKIFGADDQKLSAFVYYPSWGR